MSPFLVSFLFHLSICLFLRLSYTLLVTLLCNRLCYLEAKSLHIVLHKSTHILKWDFPVSQNLSVETFIGIASIYTSRSGVAGSEGRCMFSLKKHKAVLLNSTAKCRLTAMFKNSHGFSSPLTLDIVRLLNLWQFNGGTVVFLVVWSLMRLNICSYVHCSCVFLHLWNAYSCFFFTHWSVGLFVFLLLICRPLYIHNRNSSSVVLKIFSASHILSFLLF